MSGQVDRAPPPAAAPPPPPAVRQPWWAPRLTVGDDQLTTGFADEIKVSSGANNKRVVRDPTGSNTFLPVLKATYNKVRRRKTPAGSRETAVGGRVQLSDAVFALHCCRGAGLLPRTAAAGRCSTRGPTAGRPALATPCASSTRSSSPLTSPGSKVSVSELQEACTQRESLTPCLCAGGKLPGLLGGDTGCSGGASAEDCFSGEARLLPPDTLSSNSQPHVSNPCPSCVQCVSCGAARATGRPTCTCPTPKTPGSVRPRAPCATTTPATRSTAAPSGSRPESGLRWG